MIPNKKNDIKQIALNTIIILNIIFITIKYLHHSLLLRSRRQFFEHW